MTGMTVGCGCFNRHISQKRIDAVKRSTSLSEATYMGWRDKFKDFFCNRSKRNALTALYYLSHSETATQAVMAKQQQPGANKVRLDRQKVMLYLIATSSYEQLKNLLPAEHAQACPSETRSQWPTTTDIDHTLKIVIEPDTEVSFRFNFAVDQNCFNQNSHCANYAVTQYLNDHRASIDNAGRAASVEPDPAFNLAHQDFAEMTDIFLGRAPVAVEEQIWPSQFRQAREPAAPQNAFDIVEPAKSPEPVAIIANGEDLYPIQPFELSPATSIVETEVMPVPLMDLASPAIDSPLRTTSEEQPLSLMAMHSTSVRQQVDTIAREGREALSASFSIAVDYVKPPLTRLALGISSGTAPNAPLQAIDVIAEVDDPWALPPCLEDDPFGPPTVPLVNDETNPFDIEKLDQENRQVQQRAQRTEQSRAEAIARAKIAAKYTDADLARYAAKYSLGAIPEYDDFDPFGAAPQPSALEQAIKKVAETFRSQTKSGAHRPVEPDASQSPVERALTKVDEVIDLTGSIDHQAGFGFTDPGEQRLTFYPLSALEGPVLPLALSESIAPMTEKNLSGSLSLSPVSQLSEKMWGARQSLKKTVSEISQSSELATAKRAMDKLANVATNVRAAAKVAVQSKIEKLDLGQSGDFPAAKSARDKMDRAASSLKAKATTLVKSKIESSGMARQIVQGGRAFWTSTTTDIRGFLGPTTNGKAQSKDPSPVPASTPGRDNEKPYT